MFMKHLILFLLLLSLSSHLTIARGYGSSGSKVYDIDYRGPETHSYLPPPNRYGKKHFIHHGEAIVHSKSERVDSRTNGK